MKYMLMVLVLLFSISFALGPVFPEASSDLTCEHGCIEGHDASLEVELSTPEDWIYIHEMEIIDEHGATICRRTYEKNYSSGEVQLGCSFNLPEAEEEWWIELFLSYIYPGNEVSEEKVWAGMIEITEPECTADSHCSDDEFCEYGQCAPVECPWPFSVENHECVGYCESDSDCGPGFSCVTNECLKHNCYTDDDCPDLTQCNGFDCVEIYCQYSNQKPLNHSCVTVECESDLDCYWEEYCKDYACLPVECEDGKIESHTCIPYECNESIDCLDNESCVGFFCEPLECQEGYLPHTHGCVQCLEDSDCAENEYCSENSCIPVSCMGGEIVSHDCIRSEELPEEDISLEQKSSALEQIQPEQKEERNKGCFSAFALLSIFGLFLKNKVII